MQSNILTHTHTQVELFGDDVVLHTPVGSLPSGTTLSVCTCVCVCVCVGVRVYDVCTIHSSLHRYGIRMTKA